jgi:hypothetical protein
MDGIARRDHDARRGERARDLPHHLVRRAQFFQFTDTKIVSLAQHGGLLFLESCM